MNPETLEKLKRLLSYDRMYRTHHRNIEYIDRDPEAVLHALLDELIAHLEHTTDHPVVFSSEIDSIRTDVWAKFNM